jgi:hypothetical protein
MAIVQNTSEKLVRYLETQIEQLLYDKNIIEHKLQDKKEQLKQVKERAGIDEPEE